MPGFREIGYQSEKRERLPEKAREEIEEKN
jgi:hypothetical protein